MVLLLGAVAMLLLGAVAFVVFVVTDSARILFGFCGSFSRGSFSCVQVPRDLSGGLPERISGATLWVLDSIAEEF